MLSSLVVHLALHFEIKPKNIKYIKFTFASRSGTLIGNAKLVHEVEFLKCFIVNKRT